MRICMVLLAQRDGIELPECISKRVQQMIDFLVAIRRPDGMLPALGDDDGGCLLPLQRRSPCDARGLFGVSATHFRRRDFACASGALAPEVIWLLGDDGLRAFETLRPTTPTPNGLPVFPRADTRRCEATGRRKPTTPSSTSARLAAR